MVCCVVGNLEYPDICFTAGFGKSSYSRTFQSLKVKVPCSIEVSGYTKFPSEQCNNSEDQNLVWM